MTLTLCLHRINENSGDPYALPERKAIKLLKCLRRLPFQVNITFDDGYHDSYAFVKQYAPCFPQFNWYFFFSPEKALSGQSYAWDVRPQRMATHAELLALAKSHAVILGNHTNSHLRQASLSDAQWLAEYEQSLALYEQHFGVCRHLAFPYGTPGVDFDNRVVEFLRTHHSKIQMWSTEARLQKNVTLDVCPRIVIRNCSWPELLGRLLYYIVAKRPA